MMNAKEAVAQRIPELCRERKIAVNTLANLSGVSPSTVYSMLNEKKSESGCGVSQEALRRAGYLAAGVF